MLRKKARTKSIKKARRSDVNKKTIQMVEYDQVDDQELLADVITNVLES